MKSLYVHYKNKYPGGRVVMSDGSLDVYSKSGEHVVALRKNGAGQVVCVSEELGLRDKHCLSPIPKDSRVFKAVSQEHKPSKIGKDEKADEREQLAEEFLCPVHGDKVLSCEELEKNHGFKFDEKQRLTEGPKHS